MSMNIPVKSRDFELLKQNPNVIVVEDKVYYGNFIFIPSFQTREESDEYYNG